MGDGQGVGHSEEEEEVDKSEESEDWVEEAEEVGVDVAAVETAVVVEGARLVEPGLAAAVVLMGHHRRRQLLLLLQLLLCLQSCPLLHTLPALHPHLCQGGRNGRCR